MTRVTIRRSGAAIISISAEGHSGYAEAGSDIVCAAVSSATRLTINALTEIASISGEITVDGDKPLMGFAFRTQGDAMAPMAQAFLRAYQLEIEQIAAEYSKYIEVILMEV